MEQSAIAQVRPLAFAGAGRNKKCARTVQVAMPKMASMHLEMVSVHIH